ncbi:hypothetical protein Tco_1123828 [Tanacetum coccineum]|uniref:Uncharacterized protein n=1 Tax=Tanacetum coccineum TaxID=301880 RepID=A0ABQ5J7F2_9ASTR
MQRGGRYLETEKKDSSQDELRAMIITIHFRLTTNLEAPKLIIGNEAHTSDINYIRVRISCNYDLRNCVLGPGYEERHSTERR